MKTRSIVFALAALLLIIIAIFRFLGQPSRHDFEFFPMGGIPCKVVEYDISQKQFNEHTKLIENRVNELENIFNAYRKDSEVNLVNKKPAKEWINITPDMYAAIDKSLYWYKKTRHGFDITVMPLIKLWNESQKLDQMPTKMEIRNILRSIGSDNIKISDGAIKHSLKLERKGMRLDFGGIAKGYILDQMSDLVESRGVKRFVISCGGDVIMKGKESFRVGVQEPGGTEKDLMMILTLPPSSVVTSGHYERFFEINGKKYSHIIDPKIGKPVENNLKSITVIADNTTDADALATGIAVMGLEKTKAILKDLKGFQVVLLVENQGKYEILYSRPLSGKIEFKGKWKNVAKYEI